MRTLLAVIAMVGALFMNVPTSHADVNDFTIQNFDIKYELRRTDDKVSVLKTIETITADFPLIDQNHGIERIIPTAYDGHKTGLKIESVSRQDGTPWNYSISEDNGNKVLRIGDADRYVQGTQTYVIIYTQTNVTRYFDTTKRDEFYWDTNGTGWSVPISKLSVSLTVSDAIKASMTGDNACYMGLKDSTEQCEITEKSGVYTAGAIGLIPGQNVTLAIGFKQGTFKPYEKSLTETVGEIYEILRAAANVIGIIAIFGLIILARRWQNTSSKLKTIVPEYLPPSATSVPIAASVLARSHTTFAALLLDLAVRGYLNIIQTKEKSFFKSAEYDIEVVRAVDDLCDEEREVLVDIFGGKPDVNSRLSLSTLRNNTTVNAALLDNQSKLQKLAVSKYGVRWIDPVLRRRYARIATILAVLAIIFLSMFMGIAAISAIIFRSTSRPLSEKGVELRRKLEGLKMYIKVAETDRLKMLQSPDGAEKLRGVDVNDPSQRIKLYERLLPYAVLFGEEKQWSKQLGDYYESNSDTPSWYTGSSSFSGIAFSSGIGGFSTTASGAASYSGQSSSSGGSGGGGSSGGGGGGGGGGGW